MVASKNAPGTIVRWDVEEPLAPLTDRQKAHLHDLSSLMCAGDALDDSAAVASPCVTRSREQAVDEDGSAVTRIAGYEEFLCHYTSVEEKYSFAKDAKYTSYLGELKARRAECKELRSQIDGALENLLTLSKQYAEMSEKTTSLHDASEQLTSEQTTLSAKVDRISECIKYFKDVDLILERLDAPTLSVNSEMFFEILNKIEANTDVMLDNPTYKEASVYLIKYRHCQSKAISLLRNYIFNLFTKITESILNLPEAEDRGGNAPDTARRQHPHAGNMDAALALLYGRFQTILPKAKPVIEQVEKMSHRRREYEALLNECHQHYWSRRASVLGPSVERSLAAFKERYNGDHCSLVRHSCALLLHASVDEHRLFHQFFSSAASTTGAGRSALTAYLESLCTLLYDALRPYIIHINHLETLAEICCILRIEILDEHVQNNLEPLEGFGNVCLQLLHDVQERLVFRAHLYLQSDVLNYNPSPGDLAYPEKLKMMEDIAESIREEARQSRMRRISVSGADPEGSLERAGARRATSRSHVMTVDAIPLHAASSPADLHGMWYPTVRRTLVCLSRLYRCLDRTVFQSLSQEAISLCVRSIERAKQEIETRASLLDAELFQIKHLLILREQIAPFQVDFTVKEYSIDFSKVKTAAFGLLEKSSRLFTLSNNALLEFLLEGAPQMKEQLIDSRKHVDAKLKFSCQRLIHHVTRSLTQPILRLLETERNRTSSDDKDSRDSATAAAPPQQPRTLGNARDVAVAVADALRVIKFNLPRIQQSLQLYLANKETEFILLRPIKNNIVATFTQLHQLLTRHYTTDDLLLIACPLPEQVSVILSSTSLAVLQGNKQPTSQTAAAGEEPAAESTSFSDGASFDTRAPPLENESCANSGSDKL